MTIRRHPMMAVVLLAISLSMASLAVAADAPPPASTAPATDASTPQTTNELAQYGITWTFAEPVRYGQFVNGDYWVVGPVVIQKVAPAWDGVRNGTVVDPPVSTSQGYRKEMPFGNVYDEKLTATFPLRVEGVASVVSTIGMETPKKGGAYEALEVAAVLTVLKEPPAGPAFRPPYVKGPKPIHLTKELNWDRLPRLDKPDGLALPNVHAMDRVWLDHYAGKGNGNSVIHPRQNMEPYPGYSAIDASNIALVCLLDVPERTDAVYHLVQYGIDLFAITPANGDAWRGYGGFGNGRKWPILFAGLMLGQKEMIGPWARVKSSNSRTGTVEKFGEDCHTYYGKPTQEYPAGKPLFGNDVPEIIWKKLHSGQGGDKDARDPEGILDGPEYRQICSVTWVGPALAARLMGARQAWDHPALFDYVDRWVKESGMGNEESKGAKAGRYVYGSDFVMGVWKTYREKADIIGSRYEEPAPKK